MLQFQSGILQWHRLWNIFLVLRCFCKLPINVVIYYHLRNKYLISAWISSSSIFQNKIEILKNCFVIKFRKDLRIKLCCRTRHFFHFDGQKTHQNKDTLLSYIIYIVFITNKEQISQINYYLFWHTSYGWHIISCQKTK